MSVDKRISNNLNCRFPPPPIGRWHAVYTKEFAEKYHLPPDNISHDFSSGIEYMEMEVIPYGNDRTCFAKMLIRRPNDISYVTDSDRFNVSALPNDFKFSHYFHFEHIRDNLKPLVFVSAASRDYRFDDRGFMQTARGLYLENIISGYDYIVADYSCTLIPLHPKFFPDNYAFRLGKASILGRYIRHSNDLIDQKTKNSRIDAHQFIHIPEEIISTLYKDINFRGK